LREKRKMIASNKVVVACASRRSGTPQLLDAITTALWNTGSLLSHATMTEYAENGVIMTLTPALEN
jgi:hypothetical protein